MRFHYQQQFLQGTRASGNALLPVPTCSAAADVVDRWGEANYRRPTDRPKSVSQSVSHPQTKLLRPTGSEAQIWKLRLRLRLRLALPG